MAAIPAQPGDGLGRSLSRSETPPPPPSKDEFRTPGTGVDVYFNSPRLSRAGSVYTLSRASFAAQLNQLTSLSLPDPASLSSTVASIPTSAAAKALSNAAIQIQQWIQKAEEVLGGLDAEDDVEWAAAGGKDGVEEVEGAIKKFEVLVNVYITAIEDLRKRPDVVEAPKNELKHVLDTLDQVVTAWGRVGKLLAEVKRQVELALEFEELWNSVLGAIGQEIEALNLLVFEMEENRHHGHITEEHAVDSNVNLDISDLQTIVEEGSVVTGSVKKANNRLSMLPALATVASPNRSPGSGSPKQDSRLMELFARMQPLRASLDFLPPKLESYRNRAERIVPTACDELDQRRAQLETKYTNLQDDADKLRQELAEDNWLAAFRNADRQVRKICKSLEYGIAKLQEALENGGASSISSVLQKKINDYEAKKSHYAPNLRRVIQIIDNGVKERKTVNGEVLQIQSDAKEMWETLDSQIKQIDAALDDLASHRSQQQLRESISSIVSTELSINESAIETPGSSPASSIYHGVTRKDLPATPDASGSRTSSIRSVSSSRPSTISGKPRTSSTNSHTKRLSSNPLARLSSASPSPVSRASSNTPTPSRRGGTPVPIKERPRWNASPVVDYKKDFGHYKALSMKDANPHTRSLNGKPLNTKPSIYSYRNSSTTNLSKSSPLAQDRSPHVPNPRRSVAPRASSSLSNRPSAYSSPLSAVRTPVTPKSTGREDSSAVRPHSRTYKPSTPSSVHIPSISSAGSCGKVSLLPIPTHSVAFADDVGDGERSPTFKATLARRPATSMATTGRRSSLLPAPTD